MSITIIDPIYGNVLFGDTDGVLANHDVGGAQNLASSLNYLVGDAHDLIAASLGGDDTLQSTNTTTVVVGDGFTMGDMARGGADTIWATASIPPDDYRGAPGTYTPIAFGDALSMTGHAWGGNDRVLVDADFSDASVFGDAYDMTDDTRGGDDVISGTSTLHGIDALIGDAFSMSGRARGGADRMASTAGSTTIYGDAVVMADSTIGGNDIMRSGPAFGALYGDAGSMNGNARGGDDRLIGGFFVGTDSSVVMYGDAISLGSGARGGNDVLTSTGFSNDLMWGDAAQVAPGAITGRDAFVFALDPFSLQTGVGQDRIGDFHPGEDRIVLDVSLGIRTFDQLLPHLQTVAGGVLIYFDAGDSIMVAGVNRLTSADFVFGHGDTVTGTSHGDSLSSLGGNNIYLGGAGDDSFVIKAKAMGNTTGLQTAGLNADVVIQDFEGAGGWSAVGNDFLALTGFGPGSSLTFDHYGGTGGSTDPTLQYYALHDGGSGDDYTLFIRSLDGALLGAGDFRFY